MARRHTSKSRKSTRRKVGPTVRRFGGKELPGLYTVSILLTMNGKPFTPKALRLALDSKAGRINSLDKDNITKVLARLVKIGLVTRELQPTDSGYVLSVYSLSKDGKAVSDHLRKLAA